MIDLTHELERELSHVEPPDLWERIQSEAAADAALSVVRLTRTPARRRSLVWPAVAAVIALAVLAVTLVQREGPAPELVNPADLSIVEDAVIRPEDLRGDPEDWAPASAEQLEGRVAEEADLLDCLGDDVAAMVAGRASAHGMVVGEDFGNPEYVLSTALAFQSSAEAQVLVDTMATPAVQDCYRGLIEEQVLARADGLRSMEERPLAVDGLEVRSTVVPVELKHDVGRERYEPGELQPVSEHQVALRVIVTLTSDDVEVEVHTDVALATAGRFTALVSAQTNFTPIGDTELGTLTAVLLERLSQADSLGDTPAASPDPASTEPPLTTEALPPAGEQPADRAAAAEEVRAAVTGIFDTSTSPEERSRFSERPAVWIDANQQLEDGEFAEFVVGMYATVQEVRFTDPTHAAVRFQLVRPGGSIPQSIEIGHVVLVDGRWLWAIDSTCALLAAANVECDLSL